MIRFSESEPPMNAHRTGGKRAWANIRRK